MSSQVFQEYLNTLDNITNNLIDSRKMEGKKLTFREVRTVTISKEIIFLHSIKNLKMLTKGCRSSVPGEQDFNHNFTAF